MGSFDKLINRSVATSAGSEPETSDEEITDELAEDSVADGEARTLKEIRETIQGLLKYGLLKEAGKLNPYRVALTHSEGVTHILESLGLDIGIDGTRDLLYVKAGLDETPEQDEWSHPLVRRQRLNLGQSLLVAILRQYSVAWEQESGTSASQAQIVTDDLLPQLQIYFSDSGSESKEHTRLSILVD